MPVPKNKQELYGKVAGHMQNLGFSLSEAKEKADSAIAAHKSSGSSKKSSRGKKKGKGRGGY